MDSEINRLMAIVESIPYALDPSAVRARFEDVISDYM